MITVLYSLNASNTFSSFPVAASSLRVSSVSLEPDSEIDESCGYAEYRGFGDPRDEVVFVLEADEGAIIFSTVASLVSRLPPDKSEYGGGAESRFLLPSETTLADLTLR